MNKKLLIDSSVSLLLDVGGYYTDVAVIVSSDLAPLLSVNSFIVLYLFTVVTFLND